MTYTGTKTQDRFSATARVLGAELFGKETAATLDRVPGLWEETRPEDAEVATSLHMMLGDEIENPIDCHRFTLDAMKDGSRRLRFSCHGGETENVLVTDTFAPDALSCYLWRYLRWVHQPVDFTRGEARAAVVKADTCRRFATGGIYITRGVEALLPPSYRTLYLMRHFGGDWGDLSEADKANNEKGIRKGFRLFSTYITPIGKAYVITEADRSATTLLMADEY